MEIIAVLIGVVILAAIGFYVSRPLAQSRRAVPTGGAVDAQTLEARRESLYTQIKELDLDHETGKVNQEDYARLRADLVAQAAAVLKQIDNMTQSPAPAAPSAQDDLEVLIAARRKTRSTPAATTSAASKAADSDMEAAIAARRRTTVPVVSGLTCPNCGKPIGAEDAFCAKCGTALQTQVTP